MAAALVARQPNPKNWRRERLLGNHLRRMQAGEMIVQPVAMRASPGACQTKSRKSVMAQSFYLRRFVSTGVESSETKVGAAHTFVICASGTVSQTEDEERRERLVVLGACRYALQ
jgi:hypothetical protein